MLNKFYFRFSLLLLTVCLSAFANDTSNVPVQQQVKGIYGRFESSVKLDTSNTQDDGGPMSFLMFEDPQPKSTTEERNGNEKPQCFAAGRFAVHCMH